MKSSNIKYSVDDIVSKLKSKANPDNLEGMARYGISTTNWETLFLFCENLQKRLARTINLPRNYGQKGLMKQKF